MSEKYLNKQNANLSDKIEKNKREFIKTYKKRVSNINIKHRQPML
jgi:hypothetical protein